MMNPFLELYPNLINPFSYPYRVLLPRWQCLGTTILVWFLCWTLNSRLYLCQTKTKSCHYWTVIPGHSRNAFSKRQMMTDEGKAFVTWHHVFPTECCHTLSGVCMIFSREMKAAGNGHSPHFWGSEWGVCGTSEDKWSKSPMTVNALISRWHCKMKIHSSS
jgi:hypothetical protein